MRAALPSPPPRPAPRSAAVAWAPGADAVPALERSDLLLAGLVALVPLLLYARTLAWPALAASDAELGASGPDSVLGARALALLLAAGSTALAFVLARRLDLPRDASALVALLFAVHPFQVESVAWLSQSSARLGMFLFLLGAGLALGGGRARALAARIALVFALLAEPRLAGGVLWLMLAGLRFGDARGARAYLALAGVLASLAVASLVRGSALDASALAHVPRALFALAGHALVPFWLTPHHGPAAASSGTVLLAWGGFALLV